LPPARASFEILGATFSDGANPLVAAEANGEGAHREGGKANFEWSPIAETLLYRIHPDKTEVLTMPDKKNHHPKNPDYALLLTSVNIILLIAISFLSDGGSTGQAFGVTKTCMMQSDCGTGYICANGICETEAIPGPLTERIEPPLSFKKAPARPLFQPLKDMPLVPVPVEAAPKEIKEHHPFKDKTPPSKRTISMREKEFACENIGEVACVRGDTNNVYDPDSYKSVCTKTDIHPEPYWGNLYLDKSTGAVSQGWNTIVSPFKYADDKCQALTPAGTRCSGTEAKCLATYSSKAFGPVYKKFLCGGGVFVRGHEEYLDTSCSKSYIPQCPDGECTPGETCEMDRCCNGVKMSPAESCCDMQPKDITTTADCGRCGRSCLYGEMCIGGTCLRMG